MLYEFTELQLSQNEFFNLVFMNAPPWWKEEYYRQHAHSDPHLTEGQVFLQGLCCKSLKEVVKAVIEKSGLKGQNLTSTAVFEQLDMKAKHERGGEESEPWFKSYADLSRCFNKDLMPPIWIRNLSYSPDGKDRRERELCSDGTYYIEDGNHRALIYALRLKFNEEKDYKPFEAIHATSWEIASGVLGHLPEKAGILEHNGILPYKKDFKNGVRLPIGIRVDTYERR